VLVSVGVAVDGRIASDGGEAHQRLAALHVENAGEVGGDEVVAAGNPTGSRAGKQRLIALDAHGDHPEREG
jgi:hypothetical protein